MNTGWNHRVWDRYVGGTNKPCVERHKRAVAATNLLYHFVVHFLKARGDPDESIPDPTVLSGTQPDLVVAQKAWRMLQDGSSWSPVVGVGQVGR